MRRRTNHDLGRGVSLQSASVKVALWILVCPLVVSALASAALGVPLLRARGAILLAATQAGVNVRPFGVRYGGGSGGDRLDPPVVRRRRCRAC